MDFPSIHQAWLKAPGNRRRFIAKMSSNQLPVGHAMKNMKFWTTSRCPCCLQEGETGQHLLICPDPRCVSLRHEAIATFGTSLRTLHTHPKLSHCLLLLLRHSLLQQPLALSDMDPELRPIALAQLSLGSLELVVGRLASGWMEYQNQAFQHYAPWLKGSSWSASLIVRLWDLHFAIWEHRNAILHSPASMDSLLDMEATDLQILEEWSMGAAELHAKDQYLFRGTSAEALLAKPSRLRREWLNCVLAARYGGEAGDDPAAIPPATTGDAP